LRHGLLQLRRRLLLPAPPLADVAAGHCGRSAST
jgi:hypothetical protein